MLPVTAHDLVTVSLVWIAAGSVVWMVLEGFGLIGAQLADWRARGRRLSPIAFGMAVVLVILAWPVFVAAFARAIIADIRRTRR